MGIVVHHLERSRSHRVLWLLEELNVPYELKTHQRHPETMLAPPELRHIHPLGKSPIVVDGDDVLAESGAIISYLVDRHGRALKPADNTPQALQFNYWLHYAEGSLMPVLLVKLIFTRLEQAPAPFFIKPIMKGISRKVHGAYIDPQTVLHLDHIESHLQRNKWFAGEMFSAADIQMSYPLLAATDRLDLSARASIAEFLRRIKDRPAFKRAIEVGGPVSLSGD